MILVQRVPTAIRARAEGDGSEQGAKASPDYSVMKNRNPTCDIRTYVGGLSTCHHGAPLCI